MNQEHQAMEEENKAEDWDKLLESDESVAFLDKMAADALANLENGTVLPMDFNTEAD